MSTQALVKIFLRELEKNIYPDSSFYKLSRMDGQPNPNAQTMVVPGAGSEATITENPTQYPLQVKARQDSSTEYPLDFLTTDPIVIEQLDDLELSYDKRQNVTEDHVEALNKRIAMKLAYKWGVNVDSTRNITTTGADGTNNNPAKDSNKKQVAQDDLAMLANMMDQDDIPEAGRVLLVPAAMYLDISKIDNFMTADKIGSANLVSGQVGEIYGMRVFKRSTGVILNSSGAIQEPTHTIATSDLHGILAWHPSFVRRAEGRLNVSIDTNKPEYAGGAVMSVQTRIGGQARRKDTKGVYILKQG